MSNIVSISLAIKPVNKGLIFHYIQVKAGSLVVGDVFILETPYRVKEFKLHVCKSNKRLKPVYVTKIKRQAEVVLNNYLHPQSPYAKLNVATEECDNLSLGRLLGVSTLVWKRIYAKEKVRK